MNDIKVLRLQVETSLQEAVAKALETKRRLEQYAVIVENGKPRRIGPDEIGALLDKHKPGELTDGP